MADSSKSNALASRNPAGFTHLDPTPRRSGYTARMITFDTPGAAMHAYEQRLRRQPRSEPFVHRDAPTLWERAKAMLARLLNAVTSAADLVERAWIPRRERRDILAHLAPLEWLVRTLLVVEATTYLLMTPQGARLRATTPKVDAPAPPAPVGVRKPAFSTRILMPGWHTIAALRPVVDPRVAEREQREALERRRAEVEAYMKGETTLAPADDPAGWTCRLNVLRWRYPRESDAPPPKAAPPAKPPFRVFEHCDTNFPIHPDLVLREAPRAFDPDDDTPPHGRRLARRIEALARILANPTPAIRRLARRLAALRADHLDPLPHRAGFNRNTHAFNDNISALKHHERALLALLASEPYASEPPVDPPADPSGHKHDDG